MLLELTIPSLVTAFAGGLLVLGSRAYFVLMARKAVPPACPTVALSSETHAMKAATGNIVA
jgi:hypothetical protein